MYIYGESVKSGNAIIFISKRDIDDNIIWSKLFNVNQINTYGFDVSQNEDYLYFTPSIYQFQLHILDPNTGGCLKFYLLYYFFPKFLTN